MPKKKFLYKFEVIQSFLALMTHGCRVEEKDVGTNKRGQNDDIFSPIAGAEFQKSVTYANFRHWYFTVKKKTKNNEPINF